MSKLVISVELQGNIHADGLAERLAEIERECADRQANPYQRAELILLGVQGLVKSCEYDQSISEADFAAVLTIAN